MMGFKSFADKTTLHFDEGITGIIGPNGSGKSNLTEAIRWVMGEQSPKSLRGDNMQDVIFAGSATRAPLNRAEVVLTFDNRDRQLQFDHDEVQVTRRLFRNGESDFLINNRKVRLKEITNLFLSSGLGKHSMAIMSQGNVEAIFNNKPQDRRFIIEEAAGVASFKLKKKQAQQQLEQTDDNLQRVNDIVTELARQVEPLKEQASLARDYQEQQAKFSHLEQQVLAIEIADLNQKQTTLLQKRRSIKQRLTEIGQQLTTANQQVSANNQAQEQLALKLDQKQLQLTQLSQKLADTKGNETLHAERWNNSDVQYQTLQQQQEDLQQQQQLMQTQIAALTTAKQNLQTKLATLQATLQQKQSDLKTDPQQIQQTVTALQQQRVTNLQQQAALTNQLQFQTEQLQKSQQQLPVITKTVAKHQAACQTQKQHLTQLNTQVQQQHQQLKTQQQSVQQVTLQHQQTQQQLQVAQNQYYQQLRTVQQFQAELKSLRKIQQQHQGFYQGVRAILVAQLSGVIGVVADLISVPETYQVAIQSAASSALQSIVTTNQASAKNAIDYLRQHRQGRATFLPQTVMKSRKLWPEQLSALQALTNWQLASDVVQINSDLQNIVDYLFGNLIIVDQLNTATKVSNLLQHRYRVVTLKGDLINPGGSMTGGQVRTNLAILGQKEQIKRLEQSVQSSQNQLDKRQQQVQKLQQAVQLVSEQKKTQEQQLQQLLPQQQKLENDYQLQQQQFQQQQVQLDDLKQQQQALEQQIQQLHQQEAASHQQLQDLAHKLRQIEQNNQHQQTLIQNFDQQKNTLVQTLQTTKTQIIVTKNDLQNQQKELQQKQQTQAALQKKLQQVQQEQQQLQTTQGDVARTQQDLHQKVTQLTQQVQQLQQEITQFQQQREQLQQTSQELAPLNQRLVGLQQQAMDEQSQLSVQQAEIKQQLQQHLKHLEQDYQLSFEAAIAQVPANFDLTQAQDQMRLLQQGLTDLGSVNLAAITEYDQVKDRYEFLTQQRADLMAARQQLTTTMGEMDHEVSQRFAAMFKQVAAAFEQIFPRMFGGGHAKLVLTEPDDYLTSGIEIIAQPPGKKFQRMSLLSGGERALTAITLLFAILQVKPVPFCVLDEVEASLDDANVLRFANFLQQYDQATQFIVITHRKGTMLKVNRLYGVTMQESGVSTILTVKLEQNGVENLHGII